MARILIVEDEPITAADLEQKLAAMGHEIAGWFDTGEDAVAQAASLRLDLVLMDIRLAGAMDGIEAAARIREQCGVPVVFLTAFADAETVERACATEPFGYLLKPFTERSVATAVQVALTRSRVEQVQIARERWSAAVLAGAGEALRVEREALVAVDETCKVRFLNGQAETLLGIRAAAALGTDARALLRLAPAPGDARHPLEVALQDGAVVSAPHATLLPGEGPAAGLEVAYSAAPVTTPSGRRGAVILLRDEARTRELAVGEPRSEHRDTLAALSSSLSHEVNNPLTYNLGALQLALRELDQLRAVGAIEPASADPRTVERELALVRIESLLRDAHEGATRVAGVMRDLGSLSASARDVMPVPPHELVDLAIGFAASMPRHVRLIRRVEPAPMVQGNRWQLARVIAFALRHVGAAPRHDGDEVSVLLAVGSDPRGWARFTIEREEGRPPAAAGSAVAVPSPSDAVGTGSVAMAVAEHVVEAHGGAMTVRDRPEGTAVEIVLPPLRRGAIAADRQPAVDARRGSVLVVDDEPMIGRVLQLSLQGEHDVTAVTSAASALALLEQGDAFDVILCDLSMPGMTGQQLHEHLRGTRPDVASRMIFMSGGATSPAGARFLDEMAGRRVAKPFQTSELLPLIRERVRNVRDRAA